MEIRFSYGALSDPLEEQANKQGLTLGDKANKFEQIKKAINMCAFHVATQSQITSMEKKLHRQVCNAVKKI